MSDSYMCFLSDSRSFQDLRISSLGLYAGALSITKLPSSSKPLDIFNSISRIEKELNTYPHPLEVARSIMYRISLGILQDAEMMLDLLKNKQYDSLHRMTFQDHPFVAPVSPDPRPSQRQDDSPQVNVRIAPNVSNPLPQKINLSNESNASKPIEKITLASFKRKTEGETRDISSSAGTPTEQSVPLSDNFSTDSSANCRASPNPIIHKSLNAPEVKINPFALDSHEQIRLPIQLPPRVPQIPFNSSGISANSPVSKCDICNTVLAGERIEVSICNHKFHKDCLVNTVKALHEDGLNITCPAPNCIQDIRISVHQYLTTSPAGTLPRAYEVSNMIQCPNLSCNAMIKNTGAIAIYCTNCNFTFCKECKKKTHTGSCYQVNTEPKSLPIVRMPIVSPNRENKTEEKFCKSCNKSLGIPNKDGELIRCTKCGVGHCGSCFNFQFNCNCEKLKYNCGIKTG